MKPRPQSPAPLSVPASAPVWWSCRKKGSVDSQVTVEAKYWIDARKSSAILLKCEPDQVLCVEIALREQPAELPPHQRNGKVR